jgi:hypothetical protein
VCVGRAGDIQGAFGRVSRLVERMLAHQRSTVTRRGDAPA